VAWQSAAIDGVLWVLLCGFGALHGLVHGGEAPASIGGLAYAAGIVASTGTLSLAGAWVAGKVSSARAGQLMLRGGGAATAFAGLAFLLS
jgi:hydrogenase/urease accessory protein HupE